MSFEYKMRLEYVTHHTVILHTDGIGYLVLGMVVAVGCYLRLRHVCGV